MVDVRLYASGAALAQGKAGAVVGMVFGTLFAVAVVFAAIYVCYIGPLKDYNFSKRFAYIRKNFNGGKPYTESANFSVLPNNFRASLKN